MQTMTNHQQVFEERVLPIVLRHARVVFRGLRGDAREEAIADAVAHAWEGYVFAVRAGKEPWAFPTVLATFAVCKTRVGRKVGKVMRAKDVFNASQAGRAVLDVLEDCFDDRSPVPDQVAFKLDFPAWLATLSERNRQIVALLAWGHPAGAVARYFGLSAGRITQVRQWLGEQWQEFTA